MTSRMQVTISFFRHPVAMKPLIAGPQTIVMTLPAAMIGNLDQPAEMDLIPDVAPPDPVGSLPEKRESFFPLLSEPGYDLPSIRRPLI